MSDNDAGDPLVLTAEILKRIRLVIAERGIKASFICHSLGRSCSWWSKLMSGKRLITIWELWQIAGVLGVTVASLLPGEPRPGAPPETPVTIDDHVRHVVEKMLERQKKSNPQS